MSESKFLTVPHLSTKELARIFSKVRVNRETGCWEWTACRNREGYGKVSYRCGDVSAHRLMYAWLVEPLPCGTGKDVPVLDHLVCNNRSCCNPAHLKLVPTAANVMRGSGPPAMNARKTHCKKGHELPAEPNRTGGRRSCKTCESVANRARYQALMDGPRREEVKQRTRRNQAARRFGPKREEVLAKQREHYHRTKQLKREPKPLS